VRWNRGRDSPATEISYKALLYKYVMRLDGPRPDAMEINFPISVRFFRNLPRIYLHGRYTDVQWSLATDILVPRASI